MKPMPYLLREEPCTCHPSENHAAGISVHAVHTDHYTCRMIDDKFWRFRGKQLSNAEAAAEYWRARLKVCARGNADLREKGHLCATHKEEHRRLDIWQRFATHPHARENGYQ